MRVFTPPVAASFRFHSALFLFCSAHPESPPKIKQKQNKNKTKTKQTKNQTNKNEYPNSSSRHV